MANDSQKQMFVGIDIAKHSFDVYILPQACHRVFDNNAQGFQALYEWLQSWNAQVHIVCEATGGYENHLAYFLHERGITLDVRNPRQIAQFARALGLLAKTDKLDAKTIALFAERVQPIVRQKPIDLMPLKQLYQRKNQIKEIIQQESNRLEHADDTLASFIHDHLQFLRRQLKEINQEIKQFIKNNELFQQKMEVLMSCQGVGQEVAEALLIEVPEIGQIEKKPLAALVGVAPFNKDSGQQKGKRFAWGGRASIRKKLYMAALVATQHNPVIKAFYQKLLDQGKLKKVALVACMRKLLTILNSMVQNMTYWQSKECIN